MSNHLPIIPGLHGFGTETRAAYGAWNDPVICVVNSLRTTGGSPVWDPSYGPNNIGVFKGTLIQCINLNTLTKGTVDGHAIPANSGKIIIFEVSGTINATTPPFHYQIDLPYTSLYGQTAPSPGLTLRNINFDVNTNDVVVQHIRSRVGDNPNGVFPDYRNAMDITSSKSTDVYNVVLDHFSASWSIDVVTHIYKNSIDSSINNVTIANSFMTEPLNESLHSEPEHAKACHNDTWTSTPISHILYINNLIAHGKDRTPSISDATNFVWANNLTYNSKWFGALWAPDNAECIVNLTNNAFIGGTNSGIYATDYFISFFSSMLYNQGVGSSVYLSGNRVGEYINGSLVWNKIQTNSSDWRGVDNRNDINIPFKTTSRNVSIPDATYIDSSDVQAWVLEHSGCRPADRDSVDLRIVNEAWNGTGRIINCVSSDGSARCQKNAGGWPILAENRITLDIPANPHQDSGNGYTNLEIWLHILAAEVEGISNPCAGVICPNVCIGNDLWSQKCVDGICVADQLLATNSTNCGYDPCTGVFCPNTCIGPDLWSQKCVDGICVADELIKINSDSCDGLCTGVDCPNTCIGPDLWSQRCDPVTGHCITDQLLQEDSLNCTISDAAPTDNSSIAAYLVIGGLGLTGLAMLLLSRNKGGA